ncbi:Oxysterol-binding protein-like protein [Smittium mucronatum]|uniref:Oxysterol-binding protein-like protein n=1 Tax=Smittium mucronatum TaxID=133383 RepID=A0A1R0GR34_9FUNG|nr:Oxysterol-binding protein-like protein [Smittium mucronatum]
MPNAYDNDNNEEVFDEEPKNIILSMISQLGTNMDLSRVTLPTFVLETRSFTERVTDFMTHPDLLLDASNSSDSVDRFIKIVKYYMSGWHVHPRGVKKPYNPVLGEFFRNECTLENGSKFYFIAEQVSHHPPATAFANYCPDEGVYIRGELKPRGKFLGNSVGIYLGGSSEIYLTKHDECYHITYPNMYTRGILFGKMVLEMGDKATITCEKSDLVFKVDFKTKGFFGGVYNEVSGKIKRLSTDDTLYEISGNWQHKMTIKKKKHDSDVLFDSSVEKITKFEVPSIDDQEDNESRRKWRFVTKALKEKDLDRATEEKTKIEEAQRDSIKAMKSANIVWEPRFFKAHGDTHTPRLEFSSLSGDKATKDAQVRDFVFSKPN